MWLPFVSFVIVSLIFPELARAEPISGTLAAFGTWAAANAGTIAAVASAATTIGTTIAGAMKDGPKIPGVIEAPSDGGAMGASNLRKRKLNARGYESSIIAGLADPFRPGLKNVLGG